MNDVEAVPRERETTLHESNTKCSFYKRKKNGSKGKLQARDASPILAPLPLRRRQSPADCSCAAPCRGTLVAPHCATTPSPPSRGFGSRAKSVLLLRLFIYIERRGRCPSQRSAFVGLSHHCSSRMTPPVSSRCVSSMACLDSSSSVAYRMRSMVAMICRGGSEGRAVRKGSGARGRRGGGGAAAAAAAGAGAGAAAAGTDNEPKARLLGPLCLALILTGTDLSSSIWQRISMSRSLLK